MKKKLSTNYLSEQKDLLISQLKAELFELQQSHQISEKAHKSLQHQF